MKKLFFVSLAIIYAASCKKEISVSTEEIKPVIVQMEVVNMEGESIFYVQQLIR